MKPETAAAIRKLDLDKQQELVAFLAELMTAEQFCDSLLKPGDDGQEPTEDGEAIIGVIAERHYDHLLDPDPLLAELSRVHEAICEGRKQDALDIITEALPSVEFRPVRDQNYLFPHRVVDVDINTLF